MTELIVDLAGLLPARRKLDRLAHLRTERLLDALGSEVESQTRRRIDEEKTAPDGSAWDEWSEDYADRRPAKGGLLELDGSLLDSITYDVQTDAIVVGSNLPYAGVHQDGSEDGDTPARPYLGLSDENVADLQQLVVDWLSQELAR